MYSKSSRTTVAPPVARARARARAVARAVQPASVRCVSWTADPLGRIAFVLTEESLYCRPRPDTSTTFGTVVRHRCNRLVYPCHRRAGRKHRQLLLLEQPHVRTCASRRGCRWLCGIVALEYGMPLCRQIPAQRFVQQRLTSCWMPNYSLSFHMNRCHTSHIHVRAADDEAPVSRTSQKSMNFLRELVCGPASGCLSQVASPQH